MSALTGHTVHHKALTCHLRQCADTSRLLPCKGRRQDLQMFMLDAADPRLQKGSIRQVGRPFEFLLLLRKTLGGKPYK
jgi:hypothetical protein